MKKTTSARTVQNIHHEVRALRHRMALLSMLRTELEIQFGVAADGPDYIELDRDHWEAPLPDVVRELSLELGRAWRDARQQCEQLEMAGVDSE